MTRPSAFYDHEAFGSEATIAFVMLVIGAATVRLGRSVLDGIFTRRTLPMS